MKSFMRNFLGVTLCFALAGCDYPNDSRDTLSVVKGKTLKVGITEDPPWVSEILEPSGVEVELVKTFARRNGAEIQWVRGAEHDLMEGLAHGDFHLFIGGLQNDSPYKEKLGFTYAYFKTGRESHIMAVAPGENAFLMELETFLRENEGRLPVLIAEENKRHAH